MLINRRAILAGAGAATLTSAAVHASPRPERRLVINGNLVVPIPTGSDPPLDKATIAAVRASGLTALKMSIGGASADFDEANAELDAIDRGVRRYPTLFMPVRALADLDKARMTRQIGLISSFEASTPLGQDVGRIDHFHRRGVRVMQLSYNTPSPFASGVLSKQPSAGLTDLGRQAIARMNAIGVTLDLSHADEASTLGAIEASKRPPLITHAGCAAIHEHPRNKTDKVIKALADKGGVMGVYELCFLTAGPAQPSLDDYLAHMLHALNLAGEDHVGIGSDAFLTAFDTSPENMADWNKQIEARKAMGVGAPGEGRPPYVKGLNRPDRCAVIASALARRGCKSRVIDKIMGENFRRVFAATWTT